MSQLGGTRPTTMPGEMKSFELTRVDRDMTLRLSCRSGDQVVWFRWPSIFSNRPGVRDVWQLTDRDWFLITTRVPDRPTWFDLHPLEVSGRGVYEMAQKLRDGYEPGEPIEGPHIWRILCGDRLTWSGKSRSGSGLSAGPQRIFEFRENALVVAYFESRPDPFTWGAIEETPEGVAQGREAAHAVIKLGLPREIAADDRWSLG